MSRAYRRWAELYDRQLGGEELSASEHSEMARLAASDRASAHELQVRQQLLNLECDLDDAGATIVERALRTVQERDKVIQLRNPPPAPAANQHSRLGRTLALGALGFALAAAATTAIVLWSEPPAQPAPLAAPIPTPSPVELTFASGQVRVNGAPSVVGALALEPKSSISVSQGRACLAINAETDVCLGPDTHVELDEQRGEARSLRLLRGRVAAVLEKRPARRSFSVVSGNVTATALGTAFAVEQDAQGMTQVTVMQGRVQVARANDTARVVHAGEQLRTARDGEAALHHTTRAENLRHWALVAPRQLWQLPSVGIVHVAATPQDASVSLDGTALGPAPLSLVVSVGEHELAVERDGHGSEREHFRLAPGQERRFTLALTARTETPVPAATEPAATAVPSAAELLKQARSLVGQGAWQGAVATYQRLRNLHPKSAESHTVLVALGQLQLDRLGQPRQALRSFELYLKQGGGGLAQEARFGSLRALRALGDSAAETRAIRAYLRQYPESVDSAPLRRRLAELE